MGDLVDEPAEGDTSVSASSRVICEEFLKVLGRKEVEQPLIWCVTSTAGVGFLVYSDQDFWNSLFSQRYRLREHKS